MTTIMMIEDKEWIEETLRKFDFVQWDRYFQPNKSMLTIFGWIKREKDNYKDFLILDFVLKQNLKERNVYLVATSSLRYSKQIAEILGNEHKDCKRVEWFFDIPNMIMVDTVLGIIQPKGGENQRNHNLEKS